METKSQHRRFKGLVVSDKMAKTIVVRVDRRVMHPKYKKHYVISTRFKVHDPENKFHIGDEVTFEECRPLSRDKRWRAIY